ncbi:MAG: 3-keto-5-aminohexanoate cleavage protein [Paracoccaceae bacterium]|nr:3-keto-5-aminohexanoate cleavage protein [Paracoccaceae bacterium]
MDIGLFKAPVFIQFILGILGGIGPDAENLFFMKRTADKLFGDDYRWSVWVQAARRWDWRRQPARWAVTCASGLRTVC